MSIGLYVFIWVVWIIWTYEALETLINFQQRQRMISMGLQIRIRTMKLVNLIGAGAFTTLWLFYHITSEIWVR